MRSRSVNLINLISKEFATMHFQCIENVHFTFFGSETKKHQVFALTNLYQVKFLKSVSFLYLPLLTCKAFTNPTYPNKPIPRRICKSFASNYRFNYPYGVWPCKQACKDLKKNKQKKNKNLLIAFSGGQDSVSLLVLLFGIQSQNSIKLNLLWNHHLWHKDSFFITRHILKLSFLFKISIHSAIAIRSVKTELQARQWRLKISRRLETFYKYQSIIKAHSGTDRTETLLLNLFRGTGNISPFYSTHFSLNFSQTQKRRLFFGLLPFYSPTP